MLAPYHHTFASTGHINNVSNGRVVPVAPVIARPTQEQQAWLRLFEQPRRFNSVPTQITPPTAFTYPAAIPGIGGDYDFVEPQPWPADVIRIENNVFSATQPYPVSKRYSPYQYECDCDGPYCIADGETRFTSSCINTNLFMVCDDTNCSAGNCCGNRLRQRYQLDLVSTRVGLGVVCGSAIPKDAFIVEYVGEVLLGPAALTRSNRRFQVEMKAKASWNGPTAVYIDAAECGNESRFINHSCRPNCELSELEWTNTSRLAIFAKTDIPPLRELTFRYSDGNQSQFMCLCPNCSAIRE